MKLNLRKISKIICIMLIVIIVFVPVSQVFGQINPKNSESATADAVKNVLGKILSVGTGPLTTAIAELLNAVILVVFVLLYFIFSPVSAGATFPFPDQIIFNRIAFFDPNFINPPTYAGATQASTGEWIVKAPVVIVGGLIKNLYYTGFVIAGAAFLIAALVIGIKLAVSTIASEKAHYKQALVTWLTGLFLLFVTHFIMLVIFTANEQIVNAISNAADEVKFEVDIARAIPLVGKALSTIVNGVSSFFGGDPRLTYTEISGYGGLIMRFAIYAFGGDLTSSIICGVLLGQTCALLVMYTKRLFYSIILGVIAPLIVAADVIKKTIG